LKYIDGKYPVSPEMTLSDWKRIIKSFPRKIREIKITGGEPMLVSYFSELVNWLLAEGYFVYIISNTTIKKEFNQSDRVMIRATYHQSADRDEWFEIHKWYKERHRIEVDEIDKGILTTSSTKELCYREYGETCTGFIYSPEGKLFTVVNEMYRSYT